MKKDDLFFTNDELAEKLKDDLRLSLLGPDAIWDKPGQVFRVRNASIGPHLAAYEAPFRESLIQTENGRFVYVYLSMEGDVL